MIPLHPIFFLAAALLAVVLAAFYGFLLVLDWLLIKENEPRTVFSRAFAAFVVADLQRHVTRFTQRWRARGSTWSRTLWWVAFCFAGGYAIAVWIGGTEYLQSWMASVFRACSGAVVGFLVSRFLLRINISEITARYPDGSEAQAVAGSRALLASACVVGSGVLAVSMGM